MSAKTTVTHAHQPSREGHRGDANGPSPGSGHPSSPSRFPSGVELELQSPVTVAGPRRIHTGFRCPFAFPTRLLQHERGPKIQVTTTTYEWRFPFARSASTPLDIPPRPKRAKAKVDPPVCLAWGDSRQAFAHPGTCVPCHHRFEAEQRGRARTVQAVGFREHPRQGLTCKEVDARVPYAAAACRTGSAAGASSYAR